MNTSAFTRTSTALAAAALIAASGVAFATPASATTVAVSTGQELFDAIEAANANLGADTIVLSGTTITLDVDLPPIMESLTITGPGASVLTIDAALFDAFQTHGATALELSGFTLANTGSFGIYSNEATATLNDIVLVAGADPASCGLEIISADATITGSSFSSNCDWLTFDLIAGNAVTVSDSSFNDSAESGLSAQLDGGTLALTRVAANDNQAYGVRITADLDSSVTIADSSATGNGWGFYVTTGDDASAQISAITSTNNDSLQVELYVRGASSLTANGITATGAAGPGITVSSETTPVALSNVVSTGNSPGVVALTYAEPAAITFDTLTVSGARTAPGVILAGVGSTSFTRSSIVDNPVGGLYLHFASDPDDEDGPLAASVTDSTIARNGSSDPLGVGGIFSLGADLTLDRTTVSGNTAAEGAGIYSTAGLTLTNSTISGNSATSSAAIVASGPTSISHSTITNNTSADGKSAVVSVSDDTLISHSIIAGNGSGEDLYASDAATIDYSLVGIAAAGAGAGTTDALTAGTGNIVGKSPQLGALANNGGLTQTHLPLAGSRVIDAGKPGITGAPATDQRGQQRIVRVIDMGAVEVPDVLTNTGSTVNPALPLAGGLLLLLGAAFTVASVLRRQRRA